MSQDSPIFRESQHFSPALYMMFLACLVMIFTMPAILGESGNLFPLELCALLAIVLSMNLMYMRTTVANEGISIVFGFLFPLYIRHIPLESVKDAEAVRYEPLQDYGGWGIRGWGKRKALNARGEFGVLLTLRDDTKLLIGSQEPQELEASILNKLHGSRRRTATSGRRRED
jgi:hypothetical protein